MNEMIAQEVLNHQLNGIMFHSDMVDLFITLDIPKLERIQESQLIEESKNHVRTKQIIFKNTGKLICAKASERQEVTFHIAETQEEKLTIVKQAIQKWRAWEYQTMVLYVNACEKEPECKLWCELKRAVEKEIHNIDKMLGSR